MSNRQCQRWAGIFDGDPALKLQTTHARAQRDVSSRVSSDHMARVSSDHVAVSVVSARLRCIVVLMLGHACQKC